MVTIEPRPRSIMPGRKARTVTNVEVRFDATTDWNSSSAISATFVNESNPPAKGTSSSTGPSCSSAARRARSTSAGSTQSAATATASAPVSRSPAASLSAASAPRATTATLAPFAASSLHVAAPMPFDPPVTNAVLPARSG